MTRRAGASVMKAILDRTRRSSRNGMGETKKHGAGRVPLRPLPDTSYDGSKNTDPSAGPDRFYPCCRHRSRVDGGRLLRMEGWRFDEGDRIVGGAAWQSYSRVDYCDPAGSAHASAPGSVAEITHGFEGPCPHTRFGAWRRRYVFYRAASASMRRVV